MGMMPDVRCIRVAMGWLTGLATYLRHQTAPIGDNWNPLGLTLIPEVHV